MRRLLALFFVFVLAVPASLLSQSTCRDGTTSKSSGRGTCSHHGGVAKTGVTPKPAPLAPSTGDITLPSTSRQPTATVQRPSASTRSAVAAGGVKVWVNTKSGVYHCPGTRWYGNTKSGAYMTEGEARANGDRPAYGRACS